MDHSQIHLWCAFYFEIDDEALLAAYRDLLTPAERQQEPKFYFPKDRRRYLVTRALVRTTLSKYAEIAPHDWRFESNRYGRPAIANDSACAMTLRFNVTHTEGLIILAVAHGRDLGVDAENLRTRAGSIDIADRYFAPSEVEELHRLTKDRQRQRFFEYWTLKESYIKARGMGLSIPLDEFSFRFSPDECIDIDIHPNQKDASDRWHFWQFVLREEYLAAVGVERLLAAPDLAVRKTVPLRSDEPLDYRLLRVSAFR